MLNRRCVLASLVAALTLPGERALADRVVTDMARRRVSLPERIERVVTLGSLPVLNSFVFTMGEARTLVNGLADFAPAALEVPDGVRADLAGAPTMQLPSREPNVEAILLARPDVVLTMHRESVGPLEARGVPVVFLAWREPEDVKACMRSWARSSASRGWRARYRGYFDATLARVAGAWPGDTGGAAAGALSAARDADPAAADRRVVDSGGRRDQRLRRRAARRKPQLLAGTGAAVGPRDPHPHRAEGSAAGTAPTAFAGTAGAVREDRSTWCRWARTPGPTAPPNSR